MSKESKMQKQEEKWEQKKALLERKQKIKEEKQQFKSKKKISTTKLIMFFLFLSCSAVEVFTGWATWMSLQISMTMGTYVDFSPLVALIGAVVGEVVGLGIYALKAKAENTEGGITYLEVQHEIKEEEQAHGVG